ncbi:SCO1 protein [Polaribacter huanghezhanensis]|uniref:SCO family protein n=1 Tax=Polaribacter huanghezhanensis TaxID=1354726 RepID=UPI002649F4E8|nr:SCO family protein [Polaribacter huanghezhanensis]WKD85592.1 SCO1 protein [Polaribacter huanghezhanensis]
MSFFSTKKSLSFIIIASVFCVISLTVFYNLLSVEKKLPIYNPADVNPRLVDASIKHIKKNHKIADFSLINQNGDTITNNNYKDKIYIADFFFTRCKTICIAMAYNMSELQEYYKNDDDIMFLSHSVTPVIDSVSVLKAYAIQKGVIDGKWNVTTGSKKHIYELARKSYFAVLDEGNGDEDDFIHTEQFVLVDKDRRIRGYYDGTEKKDMQKIIADIALLKEEYNHK